MTRTPSSMILIVAVMLAVFGGMAIAAQDRYTLKLGKLAFSDFRGYENWKDVAVSQTETQLKVIVANDVMMKAYRQGLPADGKFFPDGSKIVKIEWTFKKNPVVSLFRADTGHSEGGRRHRERFQEIPGHARMGLRQFYL